MVSKVNSTNLTDATETPYYCAICDFSCGSENTWGLHLNGKIHETSMLQYELSYVPNKSQSDLDTGYCSWDRLKFSSFEPKNDTVLFSNCT